VFTNTTPVDAYRGAGRPEACYLLERMVDLAAQELAMDPLELRRKNFISKDQFPYQTPVALLYDSGNYEARLDKALESFDYGAFRKEQGSGPQAGRYLGVGFCTYVEACGLAPSQVAGAWARRPAVRERHRRVHRRGKVTVFTGSHSTARGTRPPSRKWRPMSCRSVRGRGDRPRRHRQVPFGMGSYGSRSGPVGTRRFTWVRRRSRTRRRRSRRTCSRQRGRRRLRGGKFSVKGSPGRSKTFGDVALMAYWPTTCPRTRAWLEAISFFDPGNFVFPFGTHVCVVEVARDTGR